jgi:hypothetical protein
MVATMYLRIHYFVDLLAGVAVALARLVDGGIFETKNGHKPNW